MFLGYSIGMNKGLKSAGVVPSDLVQEYAEIGVDKLVEESKEFLPALDSLGSEIPYVKTLIAAIKFPHALSDYLLGRKVNAFLYSSGLDQAKIDKFRKKFSKDKQERLWERVVFSINTHDDKMKSEIIGKLFNTLVDDFIDEDEFFTLVHATNSLNMNTLQQLKELYSLSYEDVLSDGQYYSFATLGLVDIDNSSVGSTDGAGPRYPLNQVGWKYTGIVFNFPDSRIGSVKIGKDILVAELDDSGRMTNQAYPLNHIQEKGSRYREVSLFVVTPEGHVLCNKETGLPLLAAREVVLAGSTPTAIAQKMATEYDQPLLGISTRNMEDSKVQRWSFMAKGNPEVAGAIYRLRSGIRKQLSDEVTKTDETRYYVDVVDQIGRHTEGDLKHLWGAS